MRELDGAGVDGQQAAVGEQPDDLVGVGAAELGGCDAAALDAALVIDRGQP